MRTHLLLLLVTGGFILACSGKPGDEAQADAASEALTVTTAAAETAPMPRRITLVGTLVADRQVQVAADTNGTIVETRVERGQSVEKGEVLAVIDTRLSRLSAAASTAQAAAQLAQSEVAERDCARAEELFGAGAISRAQYERTLASCRAQKEAAAAAAASRELAGTQLERTTIRAPFAGVVGERFVEIGGFVGSQSPVVTLYAPGPLRLRMTVPETQVAGVEPGRRVTFHPSALPTQAFGATVRFVSGALREQTRDLVVEAVLDEEVPALKAGMFGSAELDVGEEPMVVVPVEALRSEGPVHRLFKVSDGRAQEVVVRVGPEAGGKRAVLSDVAAGDLVVVAPPAKLRDGGKVQ